MTVKMEKSPLCFVDIAHCYSQGKKNHMGALPVIMTKTIPKFHNRESAPLGAINPFLPFLVAVHYTRKIQGPKEVNLFSKSSTKEDLGRTFPFGAFLQPMLLLLQVPLELSFHNSRKRSLGWKSLFHILVNSLNHSH